MTQLTLPFPADTEAPTAPAMQRYRKPDEVPWYRDEYPDEGVIWSHYLPTENIHFTVKQPQDDDRWFGRSGIKGWMVLVSLNIVDHHEDVLLSRHPNARMAKEYVWRRFLQDYSHIV